MKLHRLLRKMMRRLIGPPSFSRCPKCGGGTQELNTPDDGGIWQVCLDCGTISTADATGDPTWRIVERADVLRRWPPVHRELNTLADRRDF